jgi:diaminopimelate decarboxylase
VVIPAQIERNILDFENVLKSYRFPSAIHTVMKANASPSILAAGKRHACRVDVSSRGELQKALSA